MKRNFWRLILVAAFAANVAAAVVLWRSPDPMYQAQSWAAFGRFNEHDKLIAHVAEKAGLDPWLVKAVVWRESRFHTDKVGGAGERGLMQVGEAAAQDWAWAHHIAVFMQTDLFDARTNLQAGTWYLKRALEHWKDRDDPVQFALAEYNAGRKRVERWAAGSANAAAMLQAADIATTRQYAEDIMRRARLYHEAARRDEESAAR